MPLLWHHKLLMYHHVKVPNYHQLCIKSHTSHRSKHLHLHLHYPHNHNHHHHQHQQRQQQPWQYSHQKLKYHSISGTPQPPQLATKNIHKRVKSSTSSPEKSPILPSIAQITNGTHNFGSGNGSSSSSSTNSTTSSNSTNSLGAHSFSRPNSANLTNLTPLASIPKLSSGVSGFGGLHILDKKSGGEDNDSKIKLPGINSLKKNDEEKVSILKLIT
ncbi:predicted protein [Lodderomyces elongisporus NRRL YB-4239]|uniref:Uncharacterized protein n=1 Tax=Lodderomyces elongisporus (strain ATCC 11503 / CBS 2605 / JCM 1781 / NBRC 1676 / NRRL YB-4239) TaxID=379508 RepID=A5E3S0_LODEL|nr:predicted protein [Lodderomyces elongisporus NRRL YB-4239]